MRWISSETGATVDEACRPGARLICVGEGAAVTQLQAWRDVEDWERERYANFAQAYLIDWRRYKRNNRKAWFDRWPHLKKRPSRGWSRHMRRSKS